MRRTAKDALLAFAPFLAAMAALILVSLMICSEIEAAASPTCPHKGLAPSCHITEEPHCSCWRVKGGYEACVWRCELKR